MNDDYNDDLALDVNLDDLDPLDVADVDADDDDVLDSDGELGGGEPVDIDEQMKQVFGNVPKPGSAFTIADEMQDDEEDRRGI